MLAQISGQLIGQISNFMNLSKNSISKFQMLIEALTEKRAEEAPAEEAPAEEAPAEEAPAEEAPAEDAPAEDAPAEESSDD